MVTQNRKTVATPPVRCGNGLWEGYFGGCNPRTGGGAYGIRTRGLRLERAMSWATRRMRHEEIWLGILDSNQG